MDLAYYGSQRRIECDFIVAPRANPNAIELGFVDAVELRIDAHGDLAIKSGGQDLKLLRPIVYQTTGGNRREIAGQYVLNGKSRVKFQITPYDRSRPLVIDPALTLAYSTYLGGSGFRSGTALGDSGSGIAVDSGGYLYITGETYSSDFPTKNPFQGSHEGFAQGTSNIFVSKFSADGKSLIHSTYLGGSGYTGTPGSVAGDFASGIAVDTKGSAYVTGYTYSSDFPTEKPFQSSRKAPPGATNAVVTKFSTDGSSLIYSTYLGGSGGTHGGDSAYAIAVDSGGNAYVTGATHSKDFPTRSPFQGSLKSTYGNAFVTKFGADGGSLVYSTYLGGSNGTFPGDSSYGIAVDASGSAYVTGAAGSKDFPTRNPFQAALKGYQNIFVSKFSSDGRSLDYSTYLGGSSADQGRGIAVDSGGRAYVTGGTGSPDFPTKNPFQSSLKATPGNPDYGNAFLTKFSADGRSLAYSTYLGGSGGDEGYSIAADSSSSAYIVGRTFSTDFPTKNPFQSFNRSGGSDAFVTKFSPDGRALVYSTYLGGTSGSDSGSAIAVNSSGSTYVAGTTSSSDFPIQNPFQGSNKAYPRSSAFFTRFSTDGRSLVYSSYLGGSGYGTNSYGDSGNRIAVDSQGSAYVAGTASSSDFPTKNPFQAFNKAYPKSSTGFVSKFSHDGSLVYSTYLGGSGFKSSQFNGGDSVNGIAVDSGGSAYVTGGTFSSDFPTKNPFQRSLKLFGRSNAFVTKFSPAGSSLVYSTYLGGSRGSGGSGIAVDSRGSAYITGATSDSDFPTKNPFQGSPRSSSYGTAFVTKFSADGRSLVYSTYLGGTGIFGGDFGVSIAIDSHGSAYVTGGTGSNDFPVKNPFQGFNDGLLNAFVTKFSPAGNSLVYSTYLGGNGMFGDLGLGIRVDSAGSVYVTGATSSFNFPTQNPFQNSLKSMLFTAFVSKFSADGSSLVYSTYLGGHGTEIGYDIAVDSHGSAYVTGGTSSLDFPTKYPLQGSLKVGPNAFVTKFSPDGRSLVYSTYLGGGGGDGARGIAVDSNANAYVTGVTNSSDFPTKNAFQMFNAGEESGNSNAFVARLNFAAFSPTPTRTATAKRTPTPTRTPKRTPTPKPSATPK